MMGTDIEAAAIRRSDWGARRPCTRGCDRRRRARALRPRSEAVVLDIRATSVAAAWLMVRLLV